MNKILIPLVAVALAFTGCLQIPYDPANDAPVYLEVVKLFREYAEQGDMYAQYELAECYYWGKGVRVDPFEAWEWYDKAAEQGHEEARKMIELGHEEGWKRFGEMSRIPDVPEVDIPEDREAPVQADE